MVAKADVKQTNVLATGRDYLAQKCVIALNVRIRILALKCNIKMTKKTKLMIKITSDY